VESHRTAEFVPGQNRDGKGDGTPGEEIFLGGGKETSGIVVSVGVRNPHCRGGDFCCPGETHKSGRVFSHERAQQQAGGPQFPRSGHDTSLRERNFYVRTLVESGDVNEVQQFHLG
jgi:hypothetical protein